MKTTYERAEELAATTAFGPREQESLTVLLHAYVIGGAPGFAYPDGDFWAAFWRFVADAKAA